MRTGALALGVALLLQPTGGAWGGSIRVDITPGHATNQVSPVRAMGAAAGDGQPIGSVDPIYVPSNVSQMLSAGWGRISYRLNSELQVQAWHWNPSGTWSDPGGRGYWTGSVAPGPTIDHSYLYALPHRGFTHDQAYDEGYSRVVDGDPTTYWKSNPYLTSAYTGEADALHPQWVLVDLGRPRPVNAVQLTWTSPWGTAYEVQYWTGGDAIFDQANGQWQTFPAGTITGGTGGTVTLTLAPAPIAVEYVRVLMTASSGTCDDHGAADSRNCVGYALAELGIGTISGGSFTDLVHHTPNNAQQTVTYVSSVDPWHDPTDQFADEEQPGLDLVLGSGGLSRGIPAMVPVALLYGTPADAANEIAYLEARGYPLFAVELGEEPDGQLALPEDYAALYLQWATAIHAVDPTLALGGPVFQGATEDIVVWPDAGGRTSWLGRFLAYLQAHGRIADLAFMSFEHYPFDPCHIRWNDLVQEPGLVTGILQTWQADGLPPGLPLYVTEWNVTFDNARPLVDLFGALFSADFVGSFLTAGGAGSFYYAYEPGPLSGSCGGFGGFQMFTTDASYAIQSPTSEYFATELVTQEWAQPVDAVHDIVPATSDVLDPRGNALVTAYGLHRPDGQWAVLLVNKSKAHAATVTVDFHDGSDASDHSFTGPVTQVSFGAASYHWHAHRVNGFARPDGPLTTSTVPAGAGVVYTLPRASITVLRGAIS
jgi:hypothetical protein